jgi:hypothetical protein
MPGRPVPEKHAGAGGALRRVFTVVLPTLLACVVVLEIGLRLSGRPASNVTDGIFAAHGDAYRLRRNMTKVSQTPSFRCTIHTNSWGLRDRAPGPLSLGPGPYFAFVGDSLTFANGVDYDDSFVGVFADEARRWGMGAVNLAVGGHRLRDQEQVLREFLESASPRPSWVVVVFTPPFMAMFDRASTGLVVKSGYLFPADSWIVPYVTVMAGNTSAAYCFFRDAVRSLEAQIRPGAIDALVGPLEFLDRNGPAARPEFATRFEQELIRLEEEIRAAGASPVFVYLPSSTDVRAPELIAKAGLSPDRYDLGLHRDRLRRHCEARGVPLVDLAPTLEALAAKGEPLSFSQDPHYDAATNHAIGNALRASLLSLTRDTARTGR